MDKINRLIATEIMGWKFKTITENTPLRTCREDDGYFLNGKVYKFTIGYATDIWNPWQVIAHAFEVVEKMRENGYYVEVAAYKDGYGVYR